MEGCSGGSGSSRQSAAAPAGTVPEAATAEVPGGEGAGADAAAGSDRSGRAHRADPDYPEGRHRADGPGGAVQRKA